MLNNRHPVDVLRAVCGGADVSEAELDRIRREVSTSGFKLPPESIMTRFSFMSEGSFFGWTR